jgi:MFS family permease
VAAVGGVTGVLLGGVLTATVGWRAVFWVNVPIVALAVAAVPVLLHPGVRAPKLPLDLVGAVTGTAGVSALVYAIAEAQLGGWLSQRTLLLFALAAGLLGVFAAVERRARAPVLRLGMFRTRMFSAANVVMLIFTPGMFPQMYVASIYLQQVWGFNALHTGLAFVPQCLANLLSARSAGPVSVRIGIKPTLVIGLVVTAIGLALMALVPIGGSYAGNLLVPFVVFALGTGFAVETVTLASIVDVPTGEVGVAAGMISVSRQVGSALGIAVLGSIIAAHSGGSHAELATGVKIAFVVSAGLVFAAAAVALLLVPRHRPVAVPEPVPLLDG